MLGPDGASHLTTGGVELAVCAGALAAGLVLPASAAERSGAELAAAAVEAMGGAEAVAALDSLAVTADCVGPGGPYTSEVFWRRPDRTLMRQDEGASSREVLAVGERAWTPGNGVGSTPLPAGTAAMVHGHVFHLTLFELDRRFHDHRAAGPGPGGCLRVEMLDAGDRPASVCLDPETHLPSAFSFTPQGPGGTIEMGLSDWRRFGALLYFTRFTLRQGDEEYRWVYSSIRPNASELAPGGRPARRPSSGAWAPGERISLSLKDADLAEVLRSFARLAGFNLVLDPAVRGAVTVELQNVPWEQALEVILESHGLGVDDDGATWRVGSR